SWSYDVTDLALHQPFGAADVTDGTIDLGTHVLTTGQAVVYHANGGSIAGLVDGGTYYVVADDNDPGRVRLAETWEQATATPPVTIAIDSASVVGTNHRLSDGDALAARAAWSESQLKNSISASV